MKLRSCLLKEHPHFIREGVLQMQVDKEAVTRLNANNAKS
jgi:hypothetical protein